MEDLGRTNEHNAEQFDQEAEQHTKEPKIQELDDLLMNNLRILLNYDD